MKLEHHKSSRHVVDTLVTLADMRDTLVVTAVISVVGMVDTLVDMVVTLVDTLGAVAVMMVTLVVINQVQNRIQTVQNQIRNRIQRVQNLIQKVQNQNLKHLNCRKMNHQLIKKVLKLTIKL